MIIISIYIYIYTYIHMYVYVYMSMSISIYRSLSLSLSIYIYIYIYHAPSAGSYRRATGKMVVWPFWVGVRVVLEVLNLGAGQPDPNPSA